MSGGHGTEPNTEPLLFPDPVIEAYIKDVDRTLLRENLRQPVERRFEIFSRFMRGLCAFREQDTHRRGSAK